MRDYAFNAFQAHKMRAPDAPMSVESSWYICQPRHKHSVLHMPIHLCIRCYFEMAWLLMLAPLSLLYKFACAKIKNTRKNETSKIKVIAPSEMSNSPSISFQAKRRYDSDKLDANSPILSLKCPPPSSARTSLRIAA